MVCEFCKRKCHSKKTCFKVYGVPKWYKEMTYKKATVNVVLTQANSNDSMEVQMLLNGLQKLM